MVLLRHKLYVDSDIQGTLLRRATLYAIACGLYFSIILLFAESMAVPGEPITVIAIRCLDEAIYWLPGLAIIAPIVAYDILRISNRFTGPMFRLRREMKRLIQGNQAEPLTFREDDFWVEMAELFNQLRDEVEQLREAKEVAKHSQANDQGEADVPVQPRLFNKDEETTPDESEDFLATSDL